jgi:hypothetical protein
MKLAKFSDLESVGHFCRHLPITKLRQETRHETFSHVYPAFSQLRHKSSHRFLNAVVASSMSSSLEAKTIELHLRNDAQDEIVAVFAAGRSRVSRCIGQFHQTAFIPDALIIGRLSRRSNNLTAFSQVRVLDQGRRGLPVPQLVTVQSEVSRELNENGIVT